MALVTTGSQQAGFNRQTSLEASAGTDHIVAVCWYRKVTDTAIGRMAAYGEESPSQRAFGLGILNNDHATLPSEFFFDHRDSAGTYLFWTSGTTDDGSGWQHMAWQTSYAHTNTAFWKNGSDNSGSGSWSGAGTGTPQTMGGGVKLALGNDASEGGAGVSQPIDGVCEIAIWVGTSRFTMDDGTPYEEFLSKYRHIPIARLAAIVPVFPNFLSSCRNGADVYDESGNNLARFKMDGSHADHAPVGAIGFDWPTKLGPDPLTTVNITHTSDSLIKTTETVAHTGDSLINTTEDAVHTGDSLVKTAETATHTGDSLIKTTETVTHVGDSLIASVVTHLSDALIKADSTASHTSDAFVGTPATERISVVAAEDRTVIIPEQ